MRMTASPSHSACISGAGLVPHHQPFLDCTMATRDMVSRRKESTAGENTAGENFKVAVRVRPPIQRERVNRAPPQCVSSLNGGCVVIKGLELASGAGE